MASYIFTGSTHARARIERTFDRKAEDAPTDPHLVVVRDTHTRRDGRAVKRGGVRLAEVLEPNATGCVDRELHVLELDVWQADGDVTLCRSAEHEAARDRHPAADLAALLQVQDPALGHQLGSIAANGRVARGRLRVDSCHPRCLRAPGEWKSTGLTARLRRSNFEWRGFF